MSTAAILGFVVGALITALAVLFFRWEDGRAEREKAQKRHALRNAIPVTPVAYRHKGKLRVLYLEPKDLES